MLLTRKQRNRTSGVGKTGRQAVAEEYMEMRNEIKRNTTLDHKEDTTAIPGQAKKWLRRPLQKTEVSYSLQRVYAG